MDQPETAFAHGAEGAVAYQVFGSGPVDVLLIPPWLWNIEVMWEEPLVERYLTALASFARVIVFDKRGTGVSDPVPTAPLSSGALGTLPTLEQWTDDVRVVLDAVGSDTAALVGNAEGAQMAILFAATHPERTSALIVYDGAACYLRHDDYPAGIPADLVDAAVSLLFDEGQFAAMTAPSLVSDERYRRWRRRFGRLAASPTVSEQMFRHGMQWDVRPALSSIQAPTLVMHRRDNKYIHVANARYLHEHVPGSRLVELDGADCVFYAGAQDESLGEIAAFVTGAGGNVEFDRVLATVLFTDLVDSTRRAAELGDRKWHALLDVHDELAAQHVRLHRGRLIKTTGDGILATFDGPARAIRCAQQLGAALNDRGLPTRAGLHTGEVELRGQDIGGLAVNIAARIAAQAGAGEVLVSNTVRDLVIGSGIQFVSRGSRALKGVPGRWRLHMVQ